jgi:hypothetical protein
MLSRVVLTPIEAAMIRPQRSLVLLIVAAVWALAASSALAQAARTGRLSITVADQTGAVLPTANVRVVRQEGAPPQPEIPAVVASDQGIAIVGDLPEGRYTIEVEFPGFEKAVTRDVRVRSGENRVSVVLAIQKQEDSVTVTQDAQAAAADPRARFGSALTREQIDALSDDPQEMRRQLADMVGGDAVIRVDSFEGAQLPPKSQIRSIRVSRDAFAAEFHAAGGIFIDIITQPGQGSLRGGMQTRLRDGSMSGRSPFASQRPPERTQDYQLFLGGVLVKDRLGYNVNVNSTTAWETPIITAALPSGIRTETLGVRVPREFTNVNGNMDYALTRDQVLRVGFNRNTNLLRNQGIGLYDEIERAYSTETSNYQFRLQEAGPLGRRFFMNSRLFVAWSDSASTSAVEAPTIRVTDACTRGGQQLSGGRRSRNVNLASDLDYVRGIHSVRMGLSTEAGWFASDSFSNYLGTYTFESLSAFNDGRALSYTRRIGDPNIDYFNLQGALYVQDDIRIRPGLTLSPGFRYEMQTHVRDYNGLGPRFGVTWSPFKNGRTSVRASSGVFYDWLVANTYEQTLRVDGFRQREVNVAGPVYPDPGSLDGVVPPVNRYLLGDGVRMPRNIRFSGGVDQTLTRLLRVGVTYAHVRGTSLQRGLDLNGAVNGVQPDPGFVNIVQVTSDARSRLDTVSVNLDGGLSPPSSPFLSNAAPLVDWKRVRFFTFYTLGWARNNTDGDFSLPPVALDLDWGYSPQDVRHRLNAGVNHQIVRNLTSSVNINASSGTPYTLRTGLDDNGDLVFNDRPAGVDRNTERAASQWAVNVNASYAIPFGRRTTPPPPGFLISVVGNQAPTVQQITTDWRYRMQFFINVQNVTNHFNYINYSGVLTSPFLGRPTSVANPRKVDIGMNFQF